MLRLTALSFVSGLSVNVEHPRVSTNISSVKRKLQGLRSSLRRMYIAHGLSRIVMALALLLVWHFVTDTLLELPWGIRLLALIGMAGVLAVVAIRTIVYPLSRELKERDLALLVEREFPLLQDRLISALQMHEERERYSKVASAELVDATVDDGLKVAATLNFRDVVQSSRLMLASGYALLACLLLMVLVISSPETSSFWSKRLLLSTVEYPRQTHLEVRFPNNDELVRYPTRDVIDLNLTWDRSQRLVRLARGTSLRVVAEPRGRIPREATIVIRGDDGEVRESPMKVAFREGDNDERVVDYFHYNIAAVLGARQEITIESGDAREGPFVVETVPAPALKRNSRLTFTYPSYMRLEPRVQEGSRTIQNEPEGVRVNFAIETTKPLADQGARLRLFSSGVDPQELMLEPLDETRTSFALNDVAIARTVTEYEFELLGADGLRNTENYRYDVRIVADAPPEVTLEFFGRGLEDESRVPVTPTGRVPLVYKVEDRYGVKRVSLSYRIASSAGGLAEATRDFGAFDLVQRTRIEAVDTIEARLSALQQDLKGLIAAVNQGNRPETEATLTSFRGSSSVLTSALKRLVDRENRNFRVLEESQQAALDAADLALSKVTSGFLDAANKSVLEGDLKQLADGLANGQDMVNAALTGIKAYSKAAATLTREEFVLDFRELLADAQSSLSDEGQLLEAMRANGDSPITIEVRIHAEDFNYDPETGLGGTDASLLAVFELMPRTEVVKRVSRYIRNTLKKDLQRISRGQSDINRKMRDFAMANRSLLFSNDDEGQRSRRDMSSAQLAQGGLPDETRRLAEHFTNVAQAYIFNELEANDPTREQEERIQTIRVILQLLSADGRTGDGLVNDLKQARSESFDAEERADAVEKMLSTLDLNTGMTGVRPSFDRLRFARLLGSGEFNEPAALARLDERYKSLMRPDHSAERRRTELAEIIRLQGQTMLALGLVAERLKMWEGFDEIFQMLTRWYADYNDEYKKLKQEALR